jgi:uncharacterized protein
MQMSVREELEKLSRLQELDQKMDRAKKVKASAPEGAANLEKDLNSEKKNLETAQTAHADFEKQKRGLEMENLMDQDRIKNIESRLSSITDNKQYHAAAKEAEKAKKTITDREKMITELRDKITAQATAMTEIQTRVDALNQKINDKKVEIGSEVTEAEKELSTYAGDRDSIVSQINPPLMSRYNRIRTRYSEAVTFARNGHCTACNVSLPPQMWIRVQKGEELITCPSCQRMLLYQLQ